MVENVAIVGAGAMGSGIAQVAATAGHTVTIYDGDFERTQAGIQGIRDSLAARCLKGKLSSDAAEAIRSRLIPAKSIEDMSSADVVVEAIIEDFDSKKGLFQALEGCVRDDAILATNTSSISITRLAKSLKRPERFVGFHFFNPAQVMKLVEIVRGIATDQTVVDRLTQLARSWGKEPVQARSTPGFIVNRIARPFYGEAWRLYEEGAASAATIDTLLVQGGGFRMGPFRLMDMIGHDVNLAVTKSVFEAFYGDPKFRPSLAQQELVDAGWLGRKSGRGVYRYDDSDNSEEPEFLNPDLAPGDVIAAGDMGPAEPLVQALSDAGIAVTRCSGGGTLTIPGATLALTDGRTAHQRESVDSIENLVLFDLSLDYSKAAAIAVASTDTAAAEAAAGLFAAINIRAVLVRDLPGLVVMRTVAALANEATEAVFTGVATVDDIDVAMRAGVNYPLGPHEMLTVVGSPVIANVMERLHYSYGDGRYRSALPLKAWSVR